MRSRNSVPRPVPTELALSLLPESEIPQEREGRTVHEVETAVNRFRGSCTAPHGLTASRRSLGGGGVPVVGSEVTIRMIETYEAGDMITTCAWCGRVEFDDEWLMPPQAALAAIDAPNTLSHSICPKCATVPQLLGPRPAPWRDPSSTISRFAEASDPNRTR